MEKQPFLPGSEEPCECRRRTGPLTPKTFFRQYRVAILIHGLIFFLYSAITISLYYSYRTTSTPSPILPDLSISFQPEIWPMMHNSPYVGPPSEAVDKAWEDLLAPMTIRVTDEELQIHNQSSVSLPDGGHFAWLGVFHQLHCVKTLRQLNYRDHYHPNLTTTQIAEWVVHADHCIEALRTSSMCHADLASLTTFMWMKGQTKPLLSPQRPPHMCVDWKDLLTSLEGRSVSEEEVGRMRNPLG